MEYVRNCDNVVIENCRFNCEVAFLYYCDCRAKVRRTSGNIVVKNCFVSARKGFEGISFAELENCRKVIRENVELENFNCFLATKTYEIQLKNSH